MNSNISEHFDNYNTEIDNIINDYATQLELIKSKSKNSKTKPNTLSNIPIENTQNIPNDKTTQEDNCDLSLEMQNDNIKLQSQLKAANEKIKSLTSTIDTQKNEIDKLKKKITSLEISLNSKDEEHSIEIEKIQKEKQKEIDDLIKLNKKNKKNNNVTTTIKGKEKAKDKEKDKDKKPLNNDENRELIKQFYNFFNSSIELLEKANIIEENKISQLEYSDENNKENLNFAFNVLNQFIVKLISDNSEMFNQLFECKEKADTREKAHEKEIGDIKIDNMKLKKHIEDLNEIISKSKVEGNNMLMMQPRSIEANSLYDMGRNNYDTINSSINSINSFNINRDREFINFGVNNMNINNYSEIDPIKRLKVKIQELENKIRGNLQSEEQDNNYTNFY